MGKMYGVTPKCDKCGTIRLIGNTNGMPNMIGFQMQDGKTINLCQKCIMKLGSLDEKGKEEFFKGLGV